jgi:hypothetical protein
MTGQTYRIRIRSHLDPRWASWFEGLNIQHEDNGETWLTGSMPDQASLFSTLMKIRDLGLMLIAVEPIDQDRKLGE